MKTQNEIVDKFLIETGLQDFEEFYEEFSKENDRSAAILSAAFLDRILHQLLKNFFIDNNKLTSELLDSNFAYAPLSSFAPKIKVAYCLGLIAEDEFEDLQAIRKIRNAFAHQLHGLTFESPVIHKHFLKLNIINKLPPELEITSNKSPREQFIFNTILLHQIIEKRQKEILAQRRVVAPEKSFEIITL